MVLNWNIDVITSFISSISILITAIISYTSPKTKKIRSLFYIRLVFLFFSLFMFFDGLAVLLSNEMFSRISGMILLPINIFVIIGVNLTLKENYYSIGLILVCSLGILLIYFGLQPGAVGISTEMGYPRIDWRGSFNVMGMLFQGILVIYLLYWGAKTFFNAPFLIRKDASLFFFGMSIASVISMVFYLLYIIEPVYMLFSNLSLIIGLLIFTIAVIREPKLLYIFPFTIHRIVVKNREGHPLFDHDWSESNIKDTIFTGFLNAVQLMSEEVMDIGGLLDINLEEGILILKESERITVGLVASKASRLLRDSVVSFTTDFEEKFDRELKNSIDDISSYDSAYELIEKHFSNFPYKIIKSKKQLLLLTGKYVKIPLELENKLRKIFPDEEEYEDIKTELIKSPLSFFSEFSTLYKEFKDEIEKISNEEMKYLDENYEIKKE